VQHTNKIFKAILVVLTGLAIILSDQALAQTPNRGMASQVAAEPTCAGWNLATEFRLSPDQANPNPDNCGNANVWHFMESSSLARDPLTYSLLPEFITDGFFIPGIQQWQDAFNCSTSCNNKLPTVGINATGAFQQPSGISWPAGVVLVHPMPTQLAIVGWRSPINGSISVSGAFTDADGSCGDGVAWFIDRDTTTLANGSFPNGGAQSFQLSDISVSQGDFLYFIVHPNGDHFCDSTALEITLTPVELTTYRLTRIGDEVFNRSGVRPTIHDINENGEMVGSAPLGPEGENRALLLSNETVIELRGLIGGSSPSAYPSAINNLTQITGTNEIYGASGDLVTRGVLWEGGQITDLGVDQIPLASTLDINDRGQIVGVSISPEHIERPFLWQAGSTSFLETETPACPVNLGGSAQAINNNGVIVGSLSSRAVMWQADGGGITPLESPFVQEVSAAVDVNDRGQVIGFGGDDTTSTAFLWQADEVTVLLPLDYPQTFGAIPASINNLGQIVGLTRLGTSTLATLWRGSAVLDLNTLVSDDDPAKGFVTLDSATEITDSGLIVASGTDSRLTAGQGPQAYYLLTPTGIAPASAAAVPSPSTSSPPPSEKGGGAIDWLSLLLLITVLSANAAYARSRTTFRSGSP
jgi:uncharacterized membrane protein